MAVILRVQARWGGFTGSPGYSVFHFRDFAGGDPVTQDATDAAARVRTFFDAIKAYLPFGVTVQVESDVPVLEETNGELQTVLTAASQTVVTGNASSVAPFASPVGGVITWRTNGVREGRRVRGRTFLVPLSSAAFQADGSLLSAALTTFQTAAGALSTGTGTPDLGVWARPTTKVAADGIWYAVSSYSIPDMGAVLRSRRD